MPNSPQRPVLRERYERKQSKLLEAAAGVFAARGFDQTSMQQLADELGIAAGGVYHYFGGKQPLLREICGELMDPLMGRAREVLEGSEPHDQLRVVVRAWVEHVVAHRAHMLVFLQQRHVIEHGSEWRSVRDARKRFEQLIDTLLAEAEDRGQARFGDRRIAVSALLGMVNHTAQWYRPRGRLSPREIADGYVDLLVVSQRAR